MPGTGGDVDRRCGRTASLPDDDRAVSEVLAFVLAFSIIITSTALVFTVGFDLVRDFQNDQQDENAEEAFVRIARKFTELDSRSVPRRAGEISVTPGQIGLAEGSTATVTVGLPSGNRSRTFAVNALTYRNGETSVSLEGTGIFRADRDARTVIAEPDLRCGEDRATITVATLVLERGSEGVSSDLVTVVGNRRNATLWYPMNRTGPASHGSADNVTVSFDSPREDAWETYLDRTPGWTDPQDDGTYVCPSTRRVVVRHVVIGVRFV